MKKIFTSLFLFLFTSFVFETSAQIYVDSSATTGMNTGATWENAYTDLQDALANAIAGESIWVAAGTYTPDVSNGDSNSTFLIDVDIELLGGFNGTETSSDQRDPIANKTILSGDLNGDDQDDDFMNFKSDNAHTVVWITSYTTTATLLDGFTIRGGHADGFGVSGENGGGIYSEGTPTIRNCTFEQNYALVGGGAIAQFDYSGSMVILDNCHFNNNSAEGGMAVFIMESLFDIEACTFTMNVDHGGPISGNALSIVDPYGGRIRNCTFEENLAQYGTAILVWRRAEFDPGDVLVEILDCDFNNNTSNGPSDDAGSTTMLLVANGTNSSYVVKGCTFNGNNSPVGGAISMIYNPVSTNASMLIDSCDFVLNTSQWHGGAIYSWLAGDNLNLEIKNSHFIQNTVADTLGYGTVTLWGIFGGGSGTAVVDNCLFEENDGKHGGAILVRGGAETIDFQVRNSVFKSNEAISGGAIEVACSSNNIQTNLTIEDCEFTDNISTTVGGALNLTEDCNVVTRVSGCTITGNDSPKGGAIHARRNEGSSSVILIENSLITNNSSDTATIFVDSYDLTLVNNTVADNNSNGIEIANGSSLSLQNTILYNPDFTNFADITTDNTIISNGGNLIGDDSFTSHVVDADVQNEDPLFLESGDSCDYYQLTALSPAVGRGTNWINAPEFDLCGNDRVQGNQIDIGASESPFVVSAKEVILGKMAVSPNPATEFVNVQLPEIIKHPLNVQLFDAQGKLVMQQNISNDQAINLNGLGNGLYLVKINYVDKTFVGRFIKQ